MNAAQILKVAKLALLASMTLAAWTPAAGGGSGELVASLEEAVAPGWTIVMQAEGDLNKDGLPDTTAAIEAAAAGGRANTCAGNAAGLNEHERELLVLLGQAGGVLARLFLETVVQAPEGGPTHHAKDQNRGQDNE